MFDKLTVQDRAAFEAIADILQNNRCVERNLLRVMVAERGGDLNGSYSKLHDLGLVEEHIKRPSFVARILGWKPTRLVTLTAVGQVAFDILKSQLLDDGSALRRHSSVQEHSKSSRRSLFRRGSRRIVDRRPDTFIAMQLRSIRSVPAASNEPTAPSHVSLRQVGTNSRTNLKPSLFASSHYTRVLSGIPTERHVSASHTDRLEGISELLNLSGFEITRTGKLLALHRWADDHSDVEVSLEIMILAVAHAVRHSQFRTVRVNIPSLLDLIDLAEDWLNNLSTVTPACREELQKGFHTMRELSIGDAYALSIIDKLLADPMRGMAPPALLPDCLWETSSADERIV